MFHQYKYMHGASFLLSIFGGFHWIWSCDRLFNRSLRKRLIQKNTRSHSIACIWIQRHSHHCKSILEWNFVQIRVQVKCLKHSYARSKEFKYPHLTFDQTNLCVSHRLRVYIFIRLQLLSMIFKIPPCSFQHCKVGQRVKTKTCWF